jgi:multidrug efflux pump subunit AcrA (membrane-fusion protein)
MKKILIGVAILLVVTTGGYLAFVRGAAGDAANQATPTAAVVEASEQIVAEARVVPVRSAALSLPAGGIIAELLVAEGDQVQSGQTLMRLDRARAEASLAQAQAQLAQAEAAYERLLAGATPEEVATAEAQVRASQAQ